MAKLVKEFEHDLIEAISFHKNGEMTTSKKLRVVAPANVHRYQLLKLKQGYMQAMQELQSKIKPTTGGSAGEINGKDIVTLLLMSSLDLEAYFNVFKDILCANTCFVDGVVNMNHHMFDGLTLDDLESLLGVYLERFLLSSWMKS